VDVGQSDRGFATTVCLQATDSDDDRDGVGVLPTIGAIHRVHNSHFVLCCSGWQVQNNAEQNGHIFVLTA